jgi:hypothetical protein
MLNYSEGSYMYKRIDEADEVVNLATDYYAAMVNSDGDELRRVFHAKASIVGNFGDDLEYVGLEEFIGGTGDAKTGDGPFESRLDGLTLMGDTAVVTISGYSYGAWISDYLSMLKIEGRWQIVAKTYYAHAG